MNDASTHLRCVLYFVLLYRPHTIDKDFFITPYLIDYISLWTINTFEKSASRIHLTHSYQFLTAVINNYECNVKWLSYFTLSVLQKLLTRVRLNFAEAKHAIQTQAKSILVAFSCATCWMQYSVRLAKSHKTANLSEGKACAADGKIMHKLMALIIRFHPRGKQIIC